MDEICLNWYRTKGEGRIELGVFLFTCVFLMFYLFGGNDQTLAND